MGVSNNFMLYNLGAIINGGIAGPIVINCKNKVASTWFKVENA